jgi:aminoglycoside phosphotransferase (APT) family kinase protein
MNISILEFKPSFLPILQEDAEKILHTSFKIGERFNSADSFAFLLEAENEKYVAKIYRFKDWPKQGKLEYVQQLLDLLDIPHEEIVYSSHTHSTFKFGWQIARYIPGGTARSWRNEERLPKDAYFVTVGKMLKKISEIKFEYFGSLTNQDERFQTFFQYVQHELNSHDYSNLSLEYEWGKKIIERAKEFVIEHVGKFSWKHSCLVHDDTNDGNIMWREGNPLLIDWVGAKAAPPAREMAVLTFRRDAPILHLLEKGYGSKIDHQELKLHQIMRFIRSGHSFFLEDKDMDALEDNMKRLEGLLTREEPYGV